MNSVKDLLLIIFVFTTFFILINQQNFFAGFFFINCAILFGIKKYCDLKQQIIDERNYFIQTLSHDLRVSTIAQIRGLELLQKNFNSDLLNEIQKSCTYTLDMITMLLKNYQFLNNETVIQKEYFNLNEIVEYLESSLKENLNNKNLKFVSDTNIMINADKTLLLKTLKILLENAISNSLSNKNIVLSTKINNNNIHFSLTYSGKTLSYEEQERMFERNTKFSTVGQGIKMNLCKKIIEFHQGKIGVKTLNSNTQEFYFTLPNNKKPHGFYSQNPDIVINLNNYQV